MIKLFGAALLIVAYCLLIPGLTQPMLNVVGTVQQGKLIEVGRDIINNTEGVSNFIRQMANVMMDGLPSKGDIAAFDKTQSILGTASELYKSGHIPVAALILLFSVVIPIFKGVLTLGTLIPMKDVWQNRLNTTAGAISKWSMADVFVVAIFVAYLASNGLEGNSDLVEFNSQLGSGFWFFLGFCILSILATQIITWRKKP